MRVIDCEQGSTEWLRARLGIPTASRASDLLAKGRDKVSPGNARSDYALELAFERVSDSMMEFAVTPAMRRGTELEPDAREAYEARTGEFADQVGFVLHEDLACGASPDGMVNDNGLIEIKCPYSQMVIAKLWATGDISDYTDQMDWQMWVTGREWCDLVVYDPRLVYAKMDLLVIRHTLPADKAALLDIEVPLFLEEVTAMESALRKRITMMGVKRGI